MLKNQPPRSWNWRPGTAWCTKPRSTRSGPKLRYRRLISSFFPNTNSVPVEEKAEDKFPVVAAASAIAEYFRDKARETFGHHFGQVAHVGQGDLLEYCSSFGSGFPGDDDAVKWPACMEQHCNAYPPTVRRSWTAIQKRSVKMKGKR